MIQAILLLALSASAAPLITDQDLKLSTTQITQDGKVPLAYTNAPLVAVASANATVQIVLQNLSPGAAASGNIIVTGDLGGPTSYYAEFGMNSSKYSQTLYTVETASSGYVTTSDSDLVIWSGIQGDKNSTNTKAIVFGSSVATVANEIMRISTEGVRIKSTSGFILGTGVSTAAPDGMLFFISSNTAFSSVTVTNVLTSLSTYTVLANTLKLGECIVVECAFQHGGVAPGTVVAGTYMGATAIGTHATTTASADFFVRTIGTLIQTGRMLFTTRVESQAAGVTAYVATAATIGIGQNVWDETAGQTFNCKASRASGNPIQFVWMKVMKSCN